MTTFEADRNPEALDSAEPFDVCVIGSGPAGTVIGTSLAQRGVRTILIESGTSLVRWAFDPRLKQLAAYDFAGNTDYPLSKTKARLLGGNSNFWTGRCERLHPSDLERHAYTPSTNPWPITYDELDPYYEKAERSLRVRGGTRSDYAPRRKTPLPVPPNPDISYLTSLFSTIGVLMEDSPTATPTKTLRFFTVQREILPSFLASPTARLVTGATVTRLVPNSSRRIVAAELHTLGGATKQVRAKNFVMASGGIENPRTLLLSGSEQYPNGIGNSHDQVGRGFNEHPVLSFYARVPHSSGTLSLTNKIARSHQFYDEFRAGGLGSALFVSRQAWVLPHHVMPFKARNIPRNLLWFASRAVKATLFIGASTEMKISDSNRVTLSKTRVDPFGNPLAHLAFSFSEEDIRLLDACRTRIREMYRRLGATGVYEAEVSWGRHHQGTCRMGENPTTSVVDRNLRVHEAPNVYVCGSEVFATGGAMPPCLTITALAHRLADHLVGRLREG